LILEFKAAGCAGKLLFVFDGVCTPTDIQGSYNFFLFSRLRVVLVSYFSCLMAFVPQLTSRDLTLSFYFPTSEDWRLLELFWFMSQGKKKSWATKNKQIHRHYILNSYSLPRVTKRHEEQADAQTFYI